ncbi:hypothetical protein ES288_A02G059300v1 [Gossypium darwinii]|nr:hypothetical protein ES288_A02G059300v1 [Gossypium darwinii]
MIGFHLASRRRANIGLMADDVRSTTQPLPVKIAIMEIWVWPCWWWGVRRMEEKGMRGACDGGSAQGGQWLA